MGHGIGVIPIEEKLMNRTVIGLAATALLGLSGIAAAHDGGRDFDRGQGNYYGYGYGQQNGRYDRYDRYQRAPRYVVRSWHRGERLPPVYWSRSHWVTDYPRYRLYAPPRGHQWVRVDNDLLLTALATGLVLDVVYNLGR
jgi:Ni/Co efflux regulator RcnB